MPLSSSGKIDRQALPELDAVRPDVNTTYVPPRSPVEEVLAHIWADILGLDRVGVHDPFLDLGGHSLLATQIVSRVIDRFDVEVTLETLFESPTVADMAVIITESRLKSAGWDNGIAGFEETEASAPRAKGKDGSRT